MKLHELKSTKGSRHASKRVGRGQASGQGKTAGRGENGQNSRSGGGVRPGFEGGQNPIYRRLPKRGFNNFDFAKKYTLINLDDLNKLKDGDVVTNELLKTQKIVKNIKKDGIKVLGTGKLDKKLSVELSKYTKTAKQAIESKGGSVK